MLLVTWQSVSTMSYSSCKIMSFVDSSCSQEDTRLHGTVAYCALQRVALFVRIQELLWECNAHRKKPGYKVYM